MDKRTAQAKTTILEWFDKSSQPIGERAKLSSGIDLFFEDLKRRDSWSECRTVLLGNASAPRFQIIGRDWQVVRCRDGLAVSTIAPDWSGGWQSVLKNDYVRDLLSWLGHYARQYVHRSLVAKVLMIAWERDRAVLHQFASCAHYQRYGAFNSPISQKMALADSIEVTATSWGGVEKVPRIRSPWIERNTFEPAIHQAVFHFLRGQTLKSLELELEAIVAFDCVMQSLQAIGWKSPIGNPRHSRADLIKTLGLDSSDGQLTDHVYFLRNEFAAHSGGWRWWDFSEYINEDLLEKLSNLTLRALQMAADSKSILWQIDSKPSTWSDWLLDCFPELFKAIWIKATLPPEIS